MIQEDMISLLKHANKKYREGSPVISDKEYDNLLETLPKNHWYRNVIESEELKEKTYKHKVNMLSTDKCKTNEDVLKWIRKIEKVSKQVHIRTSAKLDGLAGNYYKETGDLVTRGNGEKGNIVTSAFRKGVLNISDSYGIGEIVVVKEYFNTYLKDEFSHPRNVAVGIAMGDSVNEFSQCALDNHAVHFATYKDIYAITVTLEVFKEKYRSIEENVRNNTIYPIDGVVIEVVEQEVKDILGDSSTYHRWQIALKPKDEEVKTKILSISAQTGRTGKVTPVANVESTELDGSIIKRVTLHNFKNVINKRIGIDSEIGIIRSGGVIPKLESVIKEAKNVVIPIKCESCSETLVWDKNGTDLICTNNTMCNAQIESRMLHFFNTIEVVDGFGPSTIEFFVGQGYESVADVYYMITEYPEHLIDDMGFGAKTANNLEQEIIRSMTEEIDDWRFLAAFGVRNLGKGNSKKLLKHYSIEDIFNLDIFDIMEIEGFGEITASNIVGDLSVIDHEFNQLFEDFNIKKTVLESEEVKIQSSISGKVLVFTGKMESNRKGMQEQAENLGAIIGSGVNSKTDILVTGASVGQSKINKAEKFGTKVITEQEYYKLIA